MSQTQLEECRATHAQIEALESSQIEAKRAGAAQHAAGMQQGLAGAQASLASARAAQAEAEAGLKKLDSSMRPGNWFTSKEKLEGQVAGQQAVLDAAVKAVAAAEAAVADWHGRIASAQAEERQLHDQVGLLNSLRARRTAQLDALGHQPDFAAHPAVAALSAAVSASRAEAAQNAGWAAQYAAADAGLRSALGNLQSALGMLSASRTVGRIGMVQNVRQRRRMGTTRGGPIGGDVIQLATVRRANALVAAAGTEILRVHAGLPTLPFVEPALMRSASAGIFANMLVGSQLTQVLSQVQIVNNLKQVEKMESEVKQCAQWTKANADAFRGREAAAAANANAKAAELEALRLRILAGTA